MFFCCFLALAKPVVTTNVPGAADLVIDGETGFVVRPGDINSIAEKIISLLDNPDYAGRMGNAAKEKTRELYDIEKTVDKVKAIYESLWSKKNV